MYKILGGNQKEYGPVTAEQLREWVTQQRVNAQTMVLADGATEWRPLNSFPEFAALFSPPAYGTATVSATADNPMSVVVPYKNPKALIAYYCAIFSLIPCLGLPLGIQSTYTYP